MNTHHWRWRLEVQNDFRDAEAHLQHVYYSDLAVFFEASSARGRAPARQDPGHRIKVLLNGVEVSSGTSRAEARAAVLAQVEAAPPSVLRDAREHVEVLLGVL